MPAISLPRPYDQGQLRVFTGGPGLPALPAPARDGTYSAPARDGTYSGPIRFGDKDYTLTIWSPEDWADLPCERRPAGARQWDGGACVHLRLSEQVPDRR